MSPRARSDSTVRPSSSTVVLPCLRVAALGFLVGEQFHPLFGGNVDVPSYVAFQASPLQAFFFPVVLSMAVFEVFSVFTFANPKRQKEGMWEIKADHQIAVSTQQVRCWTGVAASSSSAGTFRVYGNCTCEGFETCEHLS